MKPISLLFGVGLILLGAASAHLFHAGHPDYQPYLTSRHFKVTGLARTAWHTTKKRRFPALMTFVLLRTVNG